MRDDLGSGAARDEHEYGYEDLRAHALAHIRRESLDVFNRLRSVAEDVRFVRAVAEAYPGLPVLLDSTRAGKRMPDALSKTVPIWCAVVNRAVGIAFSKYAQWDTTLYTPPGSVSAQEHAQIATRIDDWACSLLDSSYILPNLERPLRPLWITPATSAFPHIPPPEERTFFPVVCVSASKQLEEGLERRSHGFSYVQGSGDDHELWGMGLTPDIFWKHKDELLAAERVEIEDLVCELVAQRATETCLDWVTLPTPVGAVDGRLLISKLDDLPATLSRLLPIDVSDASQDVAYVLISERSQCHFVSPLPANTDPLDTHESDQNHSTAAQVDRVLCLKLAKGKKGQIQFLGSVLPQALPFIDTQLSRGRRVCICCDTGKDASVGVALAVLQVCFDEHGQYVPLGEARDAIGMA
ncbi:hypothetical protein EIP86_004606 [Pleurotus ostreatoroseus]|nr:hypothetical protein EIP86_004606 [Pleurotus ostreatoroseus]